MMPKSTVVKLEVPTKTGRLVKITKPKYLIKFVEILMTDSRFPGDYQHVVDAVDRHWPESKFNKQHYAWYRFHFHGLGMELNKPYRERNNGVVKEKKKVTKKKSMSYKEVNDD